MNYSTLQRSEEKKNPMNGAECEKDSTNVEYLVQRLFCSSHESSTTHAHVDIARQTD